MRRLRRVFSTPILRAAAENPPYWTTEAKKWISLRSHDCDFRDMLSRIGDKWSLLVIFILKGRPAFRGRFSDLKRSIPGISQRMLTATVRNLERDGMLTRHVYAEVPPRVEYELTPLGRGLTEPVLGLVSWLQSHWPVIRSARD
jgi:DNA-binding HxlR family transcriptional regulator